MTLFAGRSAPRSLYDAVSEASSAVVIREYSSSFGLASRLLGEPVRTQVRNIYALVRVADEIVDNPDPALGRDGPGHDARLARGRRPPTPCAPATAATSWCTPSLARPRPSASSDDLVAPVLRLHAHRPRHHGRTRRRASTATSTARPRSSGLMCLRAFLAAPDGGGRPRQPTSGSPRARGGSGRPSRSSTSCATSPTTTTCCAATTSPAWTWSGSATPTATGSSTTSTRTCGRRRRGAGPAPEQPPRGPGRPRHLRRAGPAAARHPGRGDPAHPRAGADRSSCASPRAPCAGGRA